MVYLSRAFCPEIATTTSSQIRCDDRNGTGGAFAALSEVQYSYETTISQDYRPALPGVAIAL